MKLSGYLLTLSTKKVQGDKLVSFEAKMSGKMDPDTAQKMIEEITSACRCIVVTNADGGQVTVDVDVLGYGEKGDLDGAANI